MTLIGIRVIVKCNEDKAPFIGRIKTMQIMGQGIPRLFPLVTNEETGEDFLCLAAVAPYSEGLWDSLKGLSYKDQHNLVCKHHCQTPQWQMRQRGNLDNLATCREKVVKYEREYNRLPKWRWISKRRMKRKLAYWQNQERIWKQKTERAS